MDIVTDHTTLGDADVRGPPPRSLTVSSRADTRGPSKRTPASRCQAVTNRVAHGFTPYGRRLCVP